MSYQLQANAMSSKILYIDSRDADTYLQANLTSYFNYVLNENIEVPLNQRALISLNSATIPYSFYNVRSGINNKLKIQLENTTQGTTDDFTMEITEGNYDVYSFSTFIENFINTNILTLSTNVRIIIDYNRDTQKFEYNLSKRDDDDPNDRYILKFRFDDTTITQTPHIEMGFIEGSLMEIIIADTIGGVASTAQLVSTNVVDINGSIHGVYIRTNLVSDGTLDTQSGSFSNILSRIPINVNSGGIIFATPNNATHRSIVDIRTINSITIRLTDERNRILDLNGLHFQIAISVDFIYSKKPKNIPMGGLSQQGFGSSFHHEETNKTNNIDLRNDDDFEKVSKQLQKDLQNTKIKNKPKKNK
tara:strand:+ start:849 stop:1931 length:1083 start_codon:yes stop_codon:yes gene_type:complete